VANVEEKGVWGLSQSLQRLAHLAGTDAKTVLKKMLVLNKVLFVFLGSQHNNIVGIPSFVDKTKLLTRQGIHVEITKISC
jgi:hypothetical protein